MVLACPVTQLHAFQQLLGYVRITRCRHQCREPIEAGENAVLNLAWLDLTRPANNARHAKAALMHGTLGGLERRHAAVRPSEHLGPIVSSEDYNRIVRFANIFEVLEQTTNAVIQLRHPGFLKTVARLAILH